MSKHLYDPFWTDFKKFLFEMILINNNILKVCFCVTNLKTITYTEPDVTLFIFKSRSF